MTAVALPVRQNTNEWLAARLDGVTASEMPIITGNREGLLTLWAIKTRQLEPEIPDEKTAALWDIGHRIEPLLAELYTERTGRAVRRAMRLLRHPTVEWAMASLDRVSAVKGERRAVELKFAPNRHFGEGPEAVPAAVQDQVQWQAFVGGFDVVDVAVLEGSEFHVHEVARDQAYIDDLLFLATDFHRMVLAKERPPLDGSEATRRTLLRLHPHDDGQMAEPSPLYRELARQHVAAKAAAKAAEAERDRIGNVLRGMLDNYAGVSDHDYRIRYGNNRDGTKVEWPAVALALAELVDDIDTPGLLARYAAAHTRVTEGSRPLTTYVKDEETSKWL